MVHRVWGGQAKQSGKWFTPGLPIDQESARQGLSLPPGNTAEYATEVTIPSGTRIQTSVANKAFG